MGLSSLLACAAPGASADLDDAAEYADARIAEGLAGRRYTRRAERALDRLGDAIEAYASAADADEDGDAAAILSAYREALEAVDAMR